MAVKQITKRIKRGVKPVKVFETASVVEKPTKKGKEKDKNNVEKDEEDMTPEEIARMEALAQEINNTPKQVKIVKKDRGLIERTESSKIVLTEDNRQVLND